MTATATTATPGAAARFVACARLPACSWFPARGWLLALSWLAACGAPDAPVVPTVPAVPTDAQADPLATVPPPTANSAATGVCGRTPQVHDALVAAANRPNCADVTAADLASVFWLDLSGGDDPAAEPQITALRSGDFQGLTSLESLLLRNNQLVALPPDLFSDLARLHTLDLAENQLVALPPGAFQSLSQLRTLSLAANRIASLPADIFAELRRLSSLDLALNNHLERWPADALRGLPSLEQLWIGDNRLPALPSGALETLPALRYLDLSRNAIESLSPGSFRGASGLRLLWLAGNPGAPFHLTVKLERLPDPNPASPHEARIRAVLTEGAPFDLRIPLAAAGGSLSAAEATIPAGDAASPPVGVVGAPGSSLSVTALAPPPPSDGCMGTECFTGLELAAGDPLVLANPRAAKVLVPAVHLIQSTQSLDGEVPLVAGRRALLRVFATSDSANAFQPTARARFFLDGRVVHEAALTPPPAGIPTVLARGRLARTFNATIPGPVLQPGVEMAVELDPERALPLTPGSVRRIPAEGATPLNVRRARPLELTVVPIQYAWDANAHVNAAVAETARELATGRFDEGLRFARALLPVPEVNVRLREPYFTEADTSEWGAIALLEEIQLLRHLEADDQEHYHGLLAVPRFVHREGFWGFLGVAFQPGYTGITVSHGRDGALHPELGQTLAHELGHNMSLGHAPCGGPAGVDEEFPYENASVGEWGFEFEGPGWPSRLVDPVRHADLMSYCRPYWISDYNVVKAMRFRAERAPLPQAQRPVRSLLLWGGVVDGRLRLEPALAWDARPKLPERPGDYRLTGLGAGGAELFSLSFEPDDLDHGGGRSFLFALPFEAAWGETLLGVALRGPEGVATVEIEASRRLAVFTYARSDDQGAPRIRGISRDWSGSLPDGLTVPGAVEVRFGWPSRD